jgi:1-aminocyclopropane-1-carboxylate deaminase
MWSNIHNELNIHGIEPINGVSADVLRLDAVHNIISGNKIFKLKGYIDTALQQGLGLASTGGSCSNHLHALSAAGTVFGFKTKVFVQSHTSILTPTLKDILNWGTEVQWIKPQAILTTTPELDTKWLWVPAGAMGAHGLVGFNVLKPFLMPYTHIMCAAGTGTTALALHQHIQAKQRIIAISAVRATHSGFTNILKEFSNLKEWQKRFTFPDSSFIWTHDFSGKHFSEWDENRVSYTRLHEQLHHLKWDYNYTSRVLWAFKFAANAGYFNSTDRILLIHTGGLQANRCYESRYRLKLNSKSIN